MYMNCDTSKYSVTGCTPSKHFIMYTFYIEHAPADNGVQKPSKILFFSIGCRYLYAFGAFISKKKHMGICCS